MRPAQAIGDYASHSFKGPASNYARNCDSALRAWGLQTMAALTNKLLGIACWIVLLASLGITPTAEADEALDQLVQLEKRYNAQRKAGSVQEALPIAEELLARARRDFSHVPELVIIALNYLGADYFSVGQYDESVKAYRESLSLAEKKFGPDSIEVAATSNDLADTCLTMQDFGQAEKLYLRSVAIREKLQGPEHPETIM
jgi:tetratricopeptide (TPR) repeat protein